MKLFNFGQKDLRVVENNGEPWFILKDVCEVLEIDQVAGIKRRLSDDVISNHPIPDSLGRMQDTTIINEDGLYDVILESRKPEARVFRKWITSDVVPSIRKNGAYMTPETIEKTLSDPDFIINLATRLKEETAEKLRLKEKIESDRHLVLYAESMQVSKDSILVNDMSKLLKQNGIDIGEKRLFHFLREEGFLIKGGSEYNMPTQRSMNLGIMEIKVGQRSSASEGVKITRTTKITGKGQIYFINKFLKKESA